MVHYTSSLESLLALRLSLLGNFDHQLTAAESRQNIRDNVVRIINSRTGENGSGLRLTSDGYIATAHHVFESWKEEWDELLHFKPTRNISRWRENIGKTYYVQVDENTSYPLDISCWYSHPAYDLGLLKADIHQQPKPIRFNLSKCDLTYGKKVSCFPRNEFGRNLRTRRGIIAIPGNPEDRVVVTNGPITLPIEIYDSFLTTMPVKAGESGSPIITANGALQGIVIYRIGEEGETYGMAGCAKIKYLPELVDYVFYHRRPL
ncbi:trypsin-like peptidase domain-containing protein [Candidatus Woesearchaeota archaeon]|nr:trypsin-like peptidase domain-containing protein [Candidatus Woesearchaeota archaeon]